MNLPGELIQRHSSLSLGLFFQRASIYASKVKADFPMGEVVYANPVFDTDGLLGSAAMASQRDQDAL